MYNMWGELLVEVGVGADFLSPPPIASFPSLPALSPEMSLFKMLLEVHSLPGMLLVEIGVLLKEQVGHWIQHMFPSAEPLVCLSSSGGDSAS